MDGQIEVSSKEGEGTEFILRFKKTEAPKWFSKAIELKKGNTVVILDDEVLIQDVWKERLKEYDKEISFKYFKQGQEAIKYLETIEDKSKVFNSRL